MKYTTIMMLVAVAAATTATTTTTTDDKDKNKKDDTDKTKKTADAFKLTAAHAAACPAKPETTLAALGAKGLVLKGALATANLGVKTAKTKLTEEARTDAVTAIEKHVTTLTTDTATAKTKLDACYKRRVPKLLPRIPLMTPKPSAVKISTPGKRLP